MGIEFIRFDMSEYMEKHTVSRLIGAPPGYVGFGQGGQLTDAVNKHSVLGRAARDEIEKAHPDIYNILLQVMDHAALTDNNGRKSDFRNVILIMSSNAGSREMASGRIGFGDTIADTKEGKRAIERVFTPEFRNRLDATVMFGALPPEIIRKVARKFLDELDGQLVEKKVQLEISRGRPGVVRRERLRQGDGRAPDGPPGANHAQGAARERDPVREAGQRRDVRGYQGREDRRAVRADGDELASALELELNFLSQ